jgi:hypothetical protein
VEAGVFGRLLAVLRAQEAEGRHDAELATVGVAFMRDASGSDAFSKLARYESNIERALFRALQELQRLQSARLGNSQDADDAPPAAASESTEVTAPTRQAAPALSAGDQQSATERS